ncbi:MAG: hypothetical protein ACRDTX_15215 [Pseudonocardiaceae bacterium]
MGKQLLGEQSLVRDWWPALTDGLTAIAVIRRAGYTNIAEGRRWASYSFDHPLTVLGRT